MGVFREILSVRSLLTVTMGKGVTVATGFITGEAITSWTTQRAAYNSHVTCPFTTTTLPWGPVVDSGRRTSTLSQSPSADEGAPYFQLIITGTKASLGFSREMLSVRSLFSFKMGQSATVAAGFVTVEATPAWTTQRAPYNC